MREPTTEKPHRMGGTHRTYEFGNGWGASVVCSGSSYGGTEGLWELAVLGPNGSLHYDNPVAEGDVRGHLEESKVDELLSEIESYGGGDK